ncbi:MAG: hypothetical protein ACI8V4_003216, partial [Ilumatobacter sp.]
RALSSVTVYADFLIGWWCEISAVHERPGVAARPNIRSGFLSQHNRGMIVA